MPYFIGSDCIDVMDRSCIEECPVDCIYEGERKLYVNPDECIDCGACEPLCPQNAIFNGAKTGAGDAFLKDNAAFFGESLPGRQEPVGEPGGASFVGVIGVDTELVRGWPKGGAVEA